MTNADKFSVNACYAVLSAFPQEEPLYAILKMVVAVVEEQKYTKLDPQIMSKRFYEKFHFKLPYHPMQAIIQLGIENGYFEYNSSLNSVHPIWTAIDSGEFLSMLNRQENEYNDLLESFDQFLQKKYNLHSSSQELSDQVQAFIQRYGLVSKVSKQILRKVKNDFKFADYLLGRYESGDVAVLEYIDRYTVGAAFAETLTFHVPTQKYKNCRANVYLDTGFIFALLGIGSKDRSDSFQELFNDMVHLGMTPKIYQHTYDEIAGIIDTARNWIGNSNYNPAAASETAYYFVTNNWSYQKATELLGDLKEIITEDYHIQIDNPPYPHADSIRTKHEEDIKQMIIAEYRRRNERFSAEDKDYTINQDARSLFMTLHLDGGHIARTFPDINNIFITTNRTLAKVGKQLTSELIHAPGTYIPIVLTDLTWGTLIWANSPTKISPLNRANIISAAYAAFYPSEELLQKLNNTLQGQQNSGKLSPEKCYFLKTNAVALKILSQKTQNDDLNYSEQTPFEILKELQAEGYEAGILEKQEEMNQVLYEKEQESTHLLSQKQSELEDLNASKERISTELAVTKQVAKIAALKSHVREMEIAIQSAEQHLKDLDEHLNLVKNIQAQVEREVTRKCRRFKRFLTGLLTIYILVLCSIAIEASWFVSLIGVIIPALVWILGLITKHELTPQSFVNYYRNRTLLIANEKYHYSPVQHEQLNAEYSKTLSEIATMKSELASMVDELKGESAKIDKDSIDIDLVQ